MGFEKFYRNEFVQYLVATGLVVTFNGFTLRYVTNSVREEVAKVIDYNNDKIVSDSEWNSVYQKLGIVDNGKRGKDLQIPSLEKFLQTTNRRKK